MFVNIWERSGQNICYLAGAAWIANHGSFFNQALWLKNYICNGYSSSVRKHPKISGIDFVIRSNSPIFSLGFWNKSISHFIVSFKNCYFCLQRVWKFWLVFEYFLKPGINIRNIWLTRPQLAHKLLEQNFAKCSNVGEQICYSKIHQLRSFQRSFRIGWIEANCLNLPFALENSEVKSQSGEHYHYGWSHFEQLEFYTIWAPNGLNHKYPLPSISIFEAKCSLTAFLGKQGVLHLHIKIKVTFALLYCKLF